MALEGPTIRRCGPRRRQHGMTLVELLIVVTVVGILTALAVPSYRGHVIKATRADGQIELLAQATALERCFVNLNAYNHSACTTASGFPKTVAGGRYQITAPTLTAGQFVLAAAPQGVQVKDTKCKTLTLNSRMERGVSDGASDTAAKCWSR